MGRVVLGDKNGVRSSHLEEISFFRSPYWHFELNCQHITAYLYLNLEVETILQYVLLFQTYLGRVLIQFLFDITFVFVLCNWVFH